VHADIGQTRFYRGQLYKCMDVFPHLTRDGRNVTLLVIHSRCADCYQTFEITETRGNFRRRSLLRRCEECRKPGVPVDQVHRSREKRGQLSLIQEQAYRVLIELAMEQRNEVSSAARGWVRTKDWIHALVERGVLAEPDVSGKMGYYRIRRGLLKKKRIEASRGAVRAV
jgi:hypothetical protein